MNRRIGNILASGLTAVAVTMLAWTAVAQQPTQPPALPTAVATPGRPGVVVTDLVEFKAKVDAVDYNTRLVTLTGPRGNTVVVKAGPQVRNLDQINAGDQLLIRYYETVALLVRKSNEAPQATASTSVEVAAQGEKPAGVIVDTVEITAKVDDIDYAQRTVTLTGPAGNTNVFKVDPSVQRFQEVKKGDEVVLRYTEALAIALDKP